MRSSARITSKILLLTAAVCAGSCRDTPKSAPPPTFTRDIAPILFANCASCHRPGEVAPFALLSYADAAKRASAIATETRKRHMPPWLPARADFAIAGERRLSDDQIELIQRWANGGAPEGNPADLPPRPTWPEGWQFGRPDAVAEPARAYTLKPGGEDVYRNLVIRSPVASDVYVRAVEFRTNGAPIHHAVIRVDRTGASRRRDGLDGQPGFEGMSSQTVQDPGGQFIGWAPGRGPIVAPEGMPWRLERGADLVIELHMLAPKQPREIRPTIALFFTGTPPERSPLTVKLASKAIDIPPGQRDYVVTDTYELPVPVRLLGVYPHAHYLATDMIVTATFPGGTKKTLLHIPDWSFHWQQDYRYVTPVTLPSGTTVEMRYTYDNSPDNEENPRKPPVRVRFGPNSTDEMAELGLQLLPDSLADAARLAASFDERDARTNVTLGEQRVREHPDNAEYRAFLGRSYLEIGREADAIPHLEAALRLNPRLADAHDALGTALMARNRLPEAIAHFERAAALAPRDESIRFNLGNAFSHANRPREAAAAYAAALALNPDFPDAHVNLGSLLFQQGRVADALPHLQRAAELMPMSAVIHTNLANALAASGRYKDALVEVRRALGLNPDYAPARDTLSRLQSIR